MSPNSEFFSVCPEDFIPEAKLMFQDKTKSSEKFHSSPEVFKNDLSLRLINAVLLNKNIGEN
jgi:hypothetical protein